MMNFKNCSFVLVLNLFCCFIVLGQTPSPALYGCRPANAVMFYNPECQRVITSDEIRIGQGRVAGFNNDPGLDVVIPTNRADWAIATYHYHRLMSNYAGRNVDIHSILLKSMKETAMTCDPTSAYVYGVDAVNNPWSTRITNLAGATVTPTINKYPLNTASSILQNHELTIFDGCLQIDPTGIATLQSPPGDMAWRWFKPGTTVNTWHNAIKNPNGNLQSAYVCTPYIGRRKSFIYGAIGMANYDVQSITRQRAVVGVDMPILANNALDPFAMELTLCRFYNKGQWDGNAINLIKHANYTTAPRIYTQFMNGILEPDATPSNAATGYFYWKQIENGFYVLNDRVANAVLPGDNQFYGYYDCLLDWNIIKYYIDLFVKPQTTIAWANPIPSPDPLVGNPTGQADRATPSLSAGTTLPVFYHEVNAVSYEAVVQAAWNQALINSAARRGLPGNVPDGRISFRYDAKPVLDAIVFGLPVDQPNLACATCTGVNTEIIYDRNNLEICPGQFSRLEASPQATGYKYQWLKDGVAISSALGGWNPVFQAKTAGVYTLEITDGAGCTVRTECMVTVKDKPGCPTCGLTATSTVSTTPTCTGITNGQITVNVGAGGVGNYTYNWSGPTTGTATLASTSRVITGATEGHYTIEIIDNGRVNCKAFADIDVTATKSLKATITQTRAADNCSSALTANLMDNAVTCAYKVINGGPVWTDNGFGGNAALATKVYVDGALVNTIAGNNYNATPALSGVTVNVPIGSKIEVKFSVSNSWSFAGSTITLKDPTGTIVGSVNSTQPATTAPYTFENTVVTATSTCTLPYSVTYGWSPTSGVSPTNTKVTTATPATATDYQATITMTSSPFCVVISNFVNVQPGCTVLPVEWIYFTAKKYNGKGARLNWGTTKELEVAYFTVERSSDGVDFSSIGTVSSLGAHTNTYEFFDQKASIGMNYYRIRQVDISGLSHFTEVKFVDFNDHWDVVVYPNSSTSYFNVQLVELSDVPCDLQIYDLLGHELEVKSIPAREFITTIGANWGAGVYILKVIQGDNQKVIKLVKE